MAASSGQPSHGADVRLRRSEMVGRDLAELIIPPELREQHRRGLERYVTPAAGGGRASGELPACAPTAASSRSRSRSRGRGSRAAAVHRVPARRQRRNATSRRSARWPSSRPPCGASRRSWRAGPTGAGIRGRDRGSRPAAGGRDVQHGALRARRDRRRGGAWSTGGVRAVAVGTASRSTARRWPRRCVNPAAGTGRQLRGHGRLDRRAASRPRLPIGRRRADQARRPAVGRRHGLDGGREAVPAGVEQRVADFSELVALALANAEAREELAASRARIVAAGDDERRRLERNLHDGAQQRLVALALTLRMIGRKLAGGDPRRRRCSDAPKRSSPRRSRSCGSSPAASIRRSSRTAGSCRPSRCWRAAPASPSSCPSRSTSGCPPGRGGRVLHRRRGTHERLQARPTRPAYGWASVVPTAACSSRWPTTASVAPTGARARACAACGDRVEALGGKLELRSPAGSGTTLSAHIPCR